MATVEVYIDCGTVMCCQCAFLNDKPYPYFCDLFGKNPVPVSQDGLPKRCQKCFDAEKGESE